MWKPAVVRRAVRFEQERVRSLRVLEQAMSGDVEQLLPVVRERHLGQSRQQVTVPSHPIDIRPVERDDEIGLAPRRSQPELPQDRQQRQGASLRRAKVHRHAANMQWQLDLLAGDLRQSRLDPRKVIEPLLIDLTQRRVRQRLGGSGDFRDDWPSRKREPGPRTVDSNLLPQPLHGTHKLSDPQPQSSGVVLRLHLEMGLQRGNAFVKLARR
jgi:hypothetical protein